MNRSVEEYQMFINELRVLCNKHNVILCSNEVFSRNEYVIEIHDADTTGVDIPDNTVMVVDGMPMITSVGDIILNLN